VTVSWCVLTRRSRSTTHAVAPDAGSTAGALFSVVGLVPCENVVVAAHGEKLKVGDDTALIQSPLNNSILVPQASRWRQRSS
jgi:hypothetical protein